MIAQAIMGPLVLLLFGTKRLLDNSSARPVVEPATTFPARSASKIGIDGMTQEQNLMKSSTTQVAKLEWDFATWFALLSPLIGIVLGFLSLLLFAH